MPAFLRRILRKWCTRGLYQRAVGGMLLVVFSLLAVGVPLPMPSRGKDRSRPFICMDSPCGCRDAEQCWRECCCHSQAEKLAWARRHNIIPPAFVIAAAQKEIKFSLAKKTESSHKSCCQSHSQKSASCCDAKGDFCRPSNSSTAPTEPTKSAKSSLAEAGWEFALLSSVHHCQGGAKLLWLGDWNALPSETPDVGCSLIAGEWVSITNHVPLAVELSPPVPPPRLA